MVRVLLIGGGVYKVEGVGDLDVSSHESRPGVKTGRDVIGGNVNITREGAGHIDGGVLPGGGTRILITFHFSDLKIKYAT